MIEPLILNEWFDHLESRCSGWQLLTEMDYGQLKDWCSRWWVAGR